MSDLSITGREPGRTEPLTGESAHAVPDAVAPPPRHPRFPLVDGMRAVAVLCVVLVHAASDGNAIGSSVVGRTLAHMNIGVTIFFVISGFLLYRPFIASRAGGAPPPPTRDYFKRRFLRIYPAYWLVLMVYMLLPGVTVVVDGNWWPMAALVHTLPLYGGQTCTTIAHPCALADTWSLVVELSFYVTLPLYAFVMRRALSRAAVRIWLPVELAALLALSAASILLQFVILHPAPRWITATVGSYVFWFALGMTLAMVSVAFQHAQSWPWPLRVLARHPGLAWAGAAATYALLCVWLPATPFLFDRGQVAVAFIGYGLVAALLLAPAVLVDEARGLPRSALAHPAVAWLGLVSYGIFLWHGEIAVKLGDGGADLPFALVLPATLALATACAAISYYLIEQPAMRLKYRRLRDVMQARRAATGSAQQMTE